MGPNISAKLERHGFYPAGGGKIVVEIEPVKTLHAVNIDERGERAKPVLKIVHAKLPFDIAEREMSAVARRLTMEVSPECVDVVKSSQSPGNMVIIEVASEHVTEVFSTLGEIGRPGESVAEETVKYVREYISSEVAVGRFLADQLMVPMAIASKQLSSAGGSFTTFGLSLHATTNIATIGAMTGVGCSVSGERVVKVCVG
jgi:RNA 3'-terminal phosphate cyclase (ATP)